MSDQVKPLDVLKLKVVSTARIWRAKDKQVISPLEGQRSQAFREHRTALQNLRDAVDMVERKS